MRHGHPRLLRMRHVARRARLGAAVQGRHDGRRKGGTAGKDRVRPPNRQQSAARPKPPIDGGKAGEKAAARVAILEKKKATHKAQAKGIAGVTAAGTLAQLQTLTGLVVGGLISTPRSMSEAELDSGDISSHRAQHGCLSAQATVKNNRDQSSAEGHRTGQHHSGTGDNVVRQLKSDGGGGHHNTFDK